jgi:hypothetical protein
MHNSLVFRGLTVALGLTLAACGDDSVGTSSISGAQTEATSNGPGSTSGTTDVPTSGTTAPDTTSVDTLGTDSQATTEAPTTGAMTTTSTTGPDTTGTTGTTGSGTSSSGGDSTTGNNNNCLEDVPDPACNGDEGLIFVSTPPDGGSDLNSGTSKEDPVATLAEAMKKAALCPDLCDIVVSAGTYQKTVTLTSGISIYGGYKPKTFVYDLPSNVTVIAGTEARAVIAQGLNLSTRLSGFTIKGKSFNADGTSSYAVWARDIADDLLSLDKCRIEAGTGGAGVDGADGTKGGDGGLGGPASGKDGGAGGSSACGATGGSGGSAGDCFSNAGSDGSAGGDPTAGGKGGLPGKSECGGNIITDCNDKGAIGLVGMAGDAADAGTGGKAGASPDGMFDGNGFWTGGDGTSGVRGNHGRGGGGGGAGGSDYDPFTCGNTTQPGGGGGGGGGGGCGGGQGLPGGAGGGSFGIVAIDASIQVSSSILLPGKAGNGGKGGKGGNGGVGKGGGSFGKGQNGGDQSDGGGDGANGAAGGDGGGAGGGGGGCGGISVAIVRVGGAFVGQSNLDIQQGTAGDPGAGGMGGFEGNGGNKPQAAPGAAGCKGKAVDELDL